MQSINELKEKEDQALYGAELSIRSREWSRLKDCADKLTAIELLREDLTIEARSLQEDIEEEIKEVL
jgi:hypothetical protein